MIYMLFGTGINMEKGWIEDYTKVAIGLLCGSSNPFKITKKIR